VIVVARLELDIESSLPPQRVIDALIDFSDRRPDIWPGLAREFYEVYSVGDRPLRSERAASCRE
jgi:hypothetical protein